MISGRLRFHLVLNRYPCADVQLGKLASAGVAISSGFDYTAAMDWGNLESGLVGAIGGSVLGSVISYFGALILQRRDGQQRRLAAGRALLAEIVKNHEALKYLGDHRPAGYSEHVWQSHIPLIAQLLSWPELRVAAEPYLIAAEPLFGFDLADEMQEKADAYRDPSPRLMRYRPILEIREKSREELVKARNGFAAAANLLRGKLLTAAEREAFAEMPIDSPDEPIRGESL